MGRWLLCCRALTQLCRSPLRFTALGPPAVLAQVRVVVAEATLAGIHSTLVVRRPLKLSSTIPRVRTTRLHVMAVFQSVSRRMASMETTEALGVLVIILAPSLQTITERVETVELRGQLPAAGVVEGQVLGIPVQLGKMPVIQREGLVVMAVLAGVAQGGLGDDQEYLREGMVIMAR